MINFCLTNKPKLVNSNWKSKKRLKHGIWLYYDSGVEIINSPKHWIVFCGILWNGKVTDFIDSTKQNGIYYAIVIDKTSGEIQVINDFSDSFFLTYYAEGRHFVVTNEIKVYGPSFKINQYWVNWSELGHNLMEAPPKPYSKLRSSSSAWYNNVAPEFSVGVQNITPLVDVNYIGAGNVLTLQGWDDFDCQPSPMVAYSCHPWFAHKQDIAKLFSDKPKHDYKSALDTAKRIIRENCERIKEKYGTQLVHFCSTGADSLTLQSYFDEVPMYGFYIKEFNQYGESVDLYKQLYNDHSGTLHHIDIKGLDDIFNSQLPNLQKTISYTPHHMIFMHIRDVYHLNDRVIIQGTSGDRIFWHDSHYVTRHAVHRWGMKDAQQIWDRCIPHYSFGGLGKSTGLYSKQSRIDETNRYLSNPYPDFKTAMLALRYFIRQAPLTAQYMPNQLMIDPYMDLRLINLLQSSDIPTQEANILDAQIQKDMISDKLLPYLNPYKAGLDWFYDYHPNDRRFKKRMINSFLKNLQGS
jgi:hypothetical protein